MSSQERLLDAMARGTPARVLLALPVWLHPQNHRGPARLRWTRLGDR